ncbi:hypothetical protein OG225_15305 [Nocardia sp. NBC_01377]|uniref:hypothetical protein n=1 Tax=Nocardia sp. NBC_01377 TaxID=2903595 RepID=UPI0032520056
MLIATLIVTVTVTVIGIVRRVRGRAAKSGDSARTRILRARLARVSGRARNAAKNALRRPVPAMATVAALFSVALAAGALAPC